MKKKDLIITLIFIYTIFVPNIFYWIFYDNMDHSNYENRNLYEKPDLKFSEISNFPLLYDNYFNDNLAFKNEIRTIYSKILYKFNMSSNERVILGSDGWLFYNSVNDGNSMSDYRRDVNYSNEKKDNIKNNLLNISGKLKENGSKFYILIAPNKENVYSEYMPKMISVNYNSEYTRTDDLINYLNENTNLNIIYPKKMLFDNKQILDTYYKYDTHWNPYGAYLGSMELVKMIDNGFVSPKVEFGEFDFSGDLANMILMSKYLVNKEPKVLNYLNNITSRCEDIGFVTYCDASNAMYHETLLVVGDSFRENMVQYLSKLYSKTIFVHRDNFNDSLFNEYKIDVVVYETVERYSFLMDSIKILN